jgi:hypothetical protein
LQVNENEAAGFFKCGKGYGQQTFCLEGNLK